MLTLSPFPGIGLPCGQISSTEISVTRRVGVFPPSFETTMTVRADTPADLAPMLPMFRREAAIGGFLMLAAGAIGLGFAASQA